MKAKIITAILSSGAILTFSAFVDAPYSPSENQTLSVYQQKCANAIANFIAQIPAIENGRYSVSFGEAHRPVSVAREYAQRGIGIANSLHTQRLAVDLNLFDRGVYQTTTEAHKPLAEMWMQVGEQMGVTPAAGYYFNDGVHFSCEWNGVK